MIYIKTKKKFKCKKYPEIYEKTKQAWVRKKSKNKPEVARFKKSKLSWVLLSVWQHCKILVLLILKAINKISLVRSFYDP